MLTLLDDYSGSYNLLIIALLEIVCLGYVYGKRILLLKDNESTIFIKIEAAFSTSNPIPFLGPFFISRFLGHGLSFQRICIITSSMLIRAFTQFALEAL